MQPVIPGKTIGQQVAILSGVTVHDTIVADGSFKLRAGLWVVNAPVRTEPVQVAQ